MIKPFAEEGIELWEWRIKNRVSREAFADYAGVSNNTLFRYETGKEIKPMMAEIIGYARDHIERHPEDLKWLRGRRLPGRNNVKD